MDAWHVFHSWAPIPISKPCKIHSLRYSNSSYDFLMELQAWKLVTLDLKTKQPEPVEVFCVKHFSRVPCKNIPTWHFHQWESGFHGILHLCKSPPPATSAGEMLVNQQVPLQYQKQTLCPLPVFFLGLEALKPSAKKLLCNAVQRKKFWVSSRAVLQSRVFCSCELIYAI